MMDVINRRMEQKVGSGGLEEGTCATVYGWRKEEV